MSELDAVVFANEAFYLAFANRDLAAMEKVMESWTGILANSEAPRVSCRAPRA
ncbi:MAG: hypothetical protein WEA84_14500 [Rhodovibrionaceae bacterium]